uniref:Uncharacterized protein n=1 Tax=Cucumis melo TaxID=3656 RepID=A0A9I9EH48_CUCME
MKKVGANSDVHWVLFDKENRAAGFHAKSRGLWFFLYSRVYRGRVRAIIEVVLFRGISEFIHRESDLHILRYSTVYVSLDLLVKSVISEIHFMYVSSPITRKPRGQMSNSTKGRRRSIPSFQTSKEEEESSYPLRLRKAITHYYGIEEERRQRKDKNKIRMPCLIFLGFSETTVGSYRKWDNPVGVW